MFNLINHSVINYLAVLIQTLTIVVVRLQQFTRMYLDEAQTESIMINMCDALLLIGQIT